MYIKPWKNKQTLFNSLPKDQQKVMTIRTHYVHSYTKKHIHNQVIMH